MDAKIDLSGFQKAYRANVRGGGYGSANRTPDGSVLVSISKHTTTVRRPRVAVTIPEDVCRRMRWVIGDRVAMLFRQSDGILLLRRTITSYEGNILSPQLGGKKK